MFIYLHDLNYEEIAINPKHISKISGSCIWVDGKPWNVIESYETIKARLEEYYSRMKGEKE